MYSILAYNPLESPERHSLRNIKRSPNSLLSPVRNWSFTGGISSRHQRVLQVPEVAVSQKPLVLLAPAHQETLKKKKE